MNIILNPMIGFVEAAAITARVLTAWILNLGTIPLSDVAAVTVNPAKSHIYL